MILSKSQIVSLPAKNRIVFPLDVLSIDEAKHLIKLLKDHIGLFKVGLTLFVNEGFQVIKIIEDIVGVGGESKIFFDLKFHDTPETLGNVSTVLMSKSHGLKFVTVHTSEGEKIIRAVVDKMQSGTKVLGITVLTSLTEEESKELGYPGSIEERVLTRAGIAKRAGCAGVVCSGHEAKAVKQKFGKDFIVVTPGIRPSWSNIINDDQRRIMTPKEAILNGSDYIVVGRPISIAKDPVEASDKIAQEIEEALSLKS